MTFDQLLKALSNLPLPEAIREGETLFPWIETLHVLCVVTVVGTIAIVDLRLIGLASHKRSVSALIRELLPFTWTAFGLAVVFGGLLFSSKAPQYAHNLQFQLKMLIMLLAGVNMGAFHLVTQRNMRVWDELAETPMSAKIAGFASLALWGAVVFLGRWVGFTML